MPDQIPFSFDVASVSDITNQIKQLLESNFRDVLVEGEISNVNQSRNGHYYFTVKDDNAQLPCVVWRNTAQRLDVELSDGQQVVLGGDIQVYAPHGRYQMIVSLVQQAGVGRLQQKFEELKAKLQKEGLFDDAHKKPLPPFPQHIGVITSSTGAAFHDIRSTFEQRWPLATLYLHHASVQGLNSAGELVAAIETMQETPGIEVLIIGRGGGSLEDLWPFNEEKVARAIYNCKIPVISAVGHEVDFSISDFVADSRAATPTQAAMIAAPDINDLRMQIDDYATGIESFLKTKIEKYKEYVYRLGHSHSLLKVQDRMVHLRNRVMSLQEKMLHRQQTLLLNRRSRFNDIVYQLGKHNPNEPLERGFARVWQDEIWIRSKAAIDKKKTAQIEWSDGKIDVN
jgi:exodeoxyribonuclease VII large subunit